MITLSALLTADLDQFHTAATAWKALADGVDRSFETLLDGARAMEDAWLSGSAADTATARVAELRAELNAAYNPANRIASALTTHAYAVADLRAQAISLIDSARTAGCWVDVQAGTITPPTSTPPWTIPPDVAQQAHRTAAGAAHGLASILERVSGLDEATARAINANLPDPVKGFGRLAPPPLTEADVASQRGRSPRDVNAWWRSLTPGQQAQAVRDYPEIVGWLDGVPASDRNQANRTMLGRYQDELLQRRRDLLGRIQQVTDRAELNDLNDELIRTSARLDQLESTRQALERLGNQGFLLGIDCSGDGRAVIAVGNPDTARHTAVWVPGLGTDLGSTPGNVNRVLHLQEAADGHTPEASGDVSTIMWLGYDAPEATASVVTSERSKQGAIALDSFVNGLRVTHSDGNCHLTAVGHSYGSTVVAEAALSGERLGNARGLAVDDIITAGSPGMHTGSAADLNLDPHHVWAGSAADDPVANLANNPAAAPAALTGGGALFLLAWEAAHGTSPHSKSFGANEYAVDTSGHSDYWNERPDGAPTQSLDNQARIVVGDYDAVELRHGEAPEDGTGSGEDGTGSGRQR